MLAFFASRRRFFAALGAALSLRAGGRPLAPDFRAYDRRGVPRRLSDYRGQVVLLNFWATWCAPCRSEIPILNRLHKKYRERGFTVLGVAMDERGWAAVTPFLAEFAVDYPVLLGGAAVARRYGGLKTLPRSLFLDRGGRVAASHGAVVPEARLREIVEALLAEPPTTPRETTGIGSAG